MLKQQQKIYKALSDSNRIRILRMLKEKNLCVCEITAMLKLATSTVSKHLSILKEAGFIVEFKEGKWVNYMINTRSDNPLIASNLSLLNILIDSDEQIKKDKENLKTIDRKNLCCT